MKKYRTAFLLCWLNLSAVQAQIQNQQKERLEAIAVQDVPPHAPGIAVAVIKDGGISYSKYAGYADFTDSSLIGKNTRFNIASNGKQFTALAILTLIELKKISLADDIRKWLPQIYPQIKEKIRIQDLLNHTSGIRDCYDLWSLQGYTWWEQSFGNEDVLKLLSQQKELNFKPGSRYSYSNSNYILLALLIERVTGKSFVAYTNELFQKLGMPNTSFESNYQTIKGPIARAYFNFGTWTTYNWIWNVCGDGNLFTTLEDQIQWEKLLQGKGKSNISQAALVKSQQPIPSSKFKNYGYGLEFGTYKGLPYQFHEGATGAWKATTVRFPQQKLSIITFTNSGKTIPAQQTREMADLLLKLQPNAAYFKVRPSKIGDYVSDESIQGMYLTESNFSFQFEKKDGILYLKRLGRNDVALERESANIFRQKFDTAFKQEFTYTPNGTLQVTAYYTEHAPYSLTKQPELPTNFEFNSLNGTYTNDETNVTISIKHNTGKNYTIQFGTSETSIGVLIATNKILVNGYLVETNKEGFLLSRDRIQNVRFIKN